MEQTSTATHRRRWGGRVALALVGALVIAACGSDSADDATATTASDAAATDTAADTAASTGGVVTVYTGRHYGIEPVFDEFTAATGIDVRFTTGSDPELRERLLAEGDNTPADVVMTADAANIELAAADGLLAPVESDVLVAAIPAELRSADGEWFGLSQRMRVIMYSTERVTEPPTTYAELGDPQWSGRLCLRPSTHPYTQSLVASMILNTGEDATLEVVESWVANDPLYINSDTDILMALADGDCDVAVTNSYYLGRLRADDPDFPVTISWPDQETTGAHVNISAAAVTAAAPNPEGARILIEWLATDGQSSFSDANFEYPANPEVPPAEIVADFGEFVADLAAVRELGNLNAAAVELLSAAGYE